jgi:transcription elongation factor Elf1
MNERHCILCGRQAFSLKVVNSYNISKCTGCGLEYADPMPTQAQLAAFYGDYADFRARTEVTRRNAERNLDGLLDKGYVGPQSRILDFGCGGNQFVAACRERGLGRSYGFDRYVFPDGDDLLVSLEDAERGGWDLICLWGVLEHLVDPVTTLRELRGMLAENGRIVCTTVCTETRIPFQYKPPEHTLYFSRASFGELARASGLELVCVEDYFMEQDADVYLSILLRTMPDAYKARVSHSLPKFVEVPTNEVVAVFGR